MNAVEKHVLTGCEIGDSANFMHFIIGFVAFIGLVAFAFGEDVARGLLRLVFFLVVCVISYSVYDFYHGIREPPKHYKVLDFQIKPVREPPAERFMVPK